MSKNKSVHLGDGVYASFDGYQICLMANSHIHPTDTVFLNSDAYSALQMWVNSLSVLPEENQTEKEVIADGKSSAEETEDKKTKA